MLPGLGISESLRQSKVNKIDAGGLLRPNQEVIWFDVSVKEVIRLDMLNPLQHLDKAHENSLERELSFTISKQFLKAWT